MEVYAEGGTRISPTRFSVAGAMIKSRSHVKIFRESVPIANGRPRAIGAIWLLDSCAELIYFAC